MRSLMIPLTMAMLLGPLTMASAQNEPAAQPSVQPAAGAQPPSSAPAAPPPTAGQTQQPQSATGFLTGLLPILLIFVVFYFLLIMPQQRQRKKHAEMLAALKAGDKVVVLGGVHGVITRLREGTIFVKIADTTEIEVDRTAVSYKQGGDQK